MRNDAETFQPLGQKIEKPAPAAPEWQPTGSPGIERNQQGQLRNVTPPPPPDPTPWIYTGLYAGTPTTWGRAIESLRREAARQAGR